jgi:hypothetical protein
LNKDRVVLLPVAVSRLQGLAVLKEEEKAHVYRRYNLAGLMPQ